MRCAAKWESGKGKEMSQRYFNWKLAVVLVISFAVLGVTAFGVRWLRRSNRAEEGLKLGNKAYEEQRWEEAADQLGRYIVIKQDDAPVLLKYADAQLKIRPFKMSNVGQATQAYRTVLRIEDSNSVAAARLTGLYLNLPGMTGEAELIARRHLETNKDPELQRLLALALYKQRQFDKAAAELKSLIAEHPDQVSAYETLGQFAEQRRQDFPDPPIFWYDEAVKNNPSSALAYIVRARFHLRNNNQAKALTDLEQAAKLDLSDTATRLRLAAGFITANALDKAEEHLMAVQAATPTDLALWEQWAQLALKSQSKEKMLKTAEAGLKELSSQPWDFLPTAAELFIRCDRLDRATDCISELRRKDIAPATVAFMEGLVADREQKPFEAVKCWRRAIQLGNKSPQVRLGLASALLRLGDRLSALQQLRTLVSEQPDSLNGHLALARLSAHIGNWAEAAEQSRIAAQISPNNLESVLLRLQAEIQLLAASSTGENTQMWQDIEKQLAGLEKTTDGALEVKLLQLQVAMQQNALAGAEVLITELKKTYPSQLKVAMAEVRLLAAMKKEEQAISLLDETIKEFPESIEPVTYLATLLAQQSKHEKCQAAIKDAMARIQQPVGLCELGLLLADLYTLWGRSDNVYPVLSKLTQKLPNDILLKRRLLSSEQVIKSPEKAQQLVNDIKSLEGEDGWQWRHEQAKVWFGADDFEKLKSNYSCYPLIISHLKENLLANPDNQASRVLLAATYERGGDLQMALSTYRQALNRSPQNIRIITVTAAALYKAKEYDEAEDILNSVSREKLYYPALRGLQLQSYLERGRLSPASDILQDILSGDPDNIAAGVLLAQLQMRQKNYAEAEELLNKLSIQEPNSLPVTVAQIRLNVYQNKPEEALKLCDKIISNLNNASAYVLRARTLASLEQTEKAIEDFRRATTIDPDSTEAWVAKSDFYDSIGQPDKALADIQQALSLAPNNPSIQKRIISLLMTSGEPEKIRRAKAILDKALESNSEDTELQLFKARSLLAERTAPATENARQILQKITDNQPKTGEAWLLLGEISLMQGQPGKAIDAALRGLTHRTNDKTLLLLKARAEAARSPILAVPTLKVLRDLDPNDADTAVFLARMYIAADEPEKAVNLMRKQLTICDEADRRKCNTALALALHKSGNKAEARKVFDSLLQAETNDPDPIFAQVQLLVEDKLWDQVRQKAVDWFQRYPKDTWTPVTIAGTLSEIENAEAKKTAEAILRMVINDHSNCAQAIRSLGILLQMTERNKEAAELYRRTLEIRPHDVIAMNNLAWIMCEEQGKFQQALELAERGLKISPQYIDLIDTRGAVYYRLNKFDEAVHDFTTCIKLYPSGTRKITTSHFHLGRAFAKLGQKDKAIEHLHKALDLENKTGGLSTTDLSEAQRLLEKL